MVQLSGDLLCLYTAEIDTSGDTYTIEVPKREIEHGQLTSESPIQVAIFSTATSTEESSSQSPAATHTDHSKSPPVDEGDIVDVEIDSLGDQGMASDGLARDTSSSFPILMLENGLAFGSLKQRTMSPSLMWSNDTIRGINFQEEAGFSRLWIWIILSLDFPPRGGSPDTTATTG